MRRIRYSVASSLDGYIAGPKGEIDWIVMDPAIDFASIMNQFDTVLMGRLTYEHMLASGQGGMTGMATIVVSDTLERDMHPSVTVLCGTNLRAKLRELKESAGRDIWLFGGGSLASHLIADNLVDSVEVMVMPALVGGGTPLFQGLLKKLTLIEHRSYKTGIVSLKYECTSTRRIDESA